jgi:hypothetical protein
MNGEGFPCKACREKPRTALFQLKTPEKEKGLKERTVPCESLFLISQPAEQLGRACS